MTETPQTAPDLAGAAVAAIHLYPVKGFSAQVLPQVTLAPGEGLPHDRRFAVIHGATTFDPAHPAWKPKTNFLALVRDERLATLRADYDPATCTLVLNRDGKPVAKGRIDTPTGRLLIDQFLGAYLQGQVQAPGPYRLVEAPGHMFSDIPEKAISLINLASCRDLERITHAPVDPRRFRGNLLIEGLAPWAETRLVGRHIRVGGALLKVFKTIVRCAATEVDPETGSRDMNVLKSLKAGFGHVECGIYATVVAGGLVSPGDRLLLEASP